MAVLSLEVTRRNLWKS